MKNKTNFQKARAFITDEVGIAYRAVTITRKINKLYTVGTKNATKILKDGDIVEVDADNGIVRKIK